MSIKLINLCDVNIGEHLYIKAVFEDSISNNKYYYIENVKDNIAYLNVMLDNKLLPIPDDNTFNECLDILKKINITNITEVNYE